ncbi:hypothetical protein KV112_20610 [Mycolicibacter sp. MYC123]|uniref:Uncharacterized protein n=1 Tax=[Mycobacterium] zoologicum TaxID=2872311 RepID=A0ABU5YPX0_9MYCO|nr:hypothetical protein [Mycolicibacter sp. MYC123]MEB3052117.1 hypothetical protein [Mycolicibacter sp. MYC123]
MSAWESVERIGLEGLEDLARELGILAWTEPPEQSVWSLLWSGKLPRTDYRGCEPVSVREMPGDTDSVIIEWELKGARTHVGMLNAVAEQMLTSLAINRVLKTERVSESSRVIQILTNDRVVHWPAQEQERVVAETPIVVRSWRTSYSTLIGGPR